MADYCSFSASRLAELLSRKEASSEEITRAYLERISTVDSKVRAFTQVFHYRALDDAKRADQERARGEVRGPLHGLPVTVKECLDVAGFPTTLGIPVRTNGRAVRDAAMVTLLREAGAVILGRTNLSQLMLFNESRNPVFGQTANPFRLSHTCGGSSGGEAAALASGMSPLGVGTDIGGSIRVPSHFCGIAGLKPTLDRLPCQGIQTGIPGQECVRAMVGPMARTVGDLALFMRAFDPQRMSALDSRVPPLAFGDPEKYQPSQLRIGFYSDDGFIRVSRGIVRGIEEAAAALRGRGFQVVPFSPPGVMDAVYKYIAALTSDGGRTAMKDLSPSQMDPVILSLKRMMSLPAGVRSSLARVLQATGEPNVARLLTVLGEKGVDQFWQITYALRGYRAAFIDAMDAQKLDVLLAPIHATPAFRHGLARDFVISGSTAMLYNLLQFPAGVAPVTRIRPTETERTVVTDRWEKRARDIDAESAGLPVGVQVVGRPWQEDKVLAVMMAIEEEARKSEGFPHTPVQELLVA